MAKKTKPVNTGEATEGRPQKSDGQKEYRYRVQFDIGYRGTPGQKFNGESMTVPDMNLTVRQLLENHTRGKDNKVHVSKPLFFDTLIPQINDITDVENFRNMLEDQIKRVNGFIEQESKEKLEKEKEERDKRQKDLFDEIEAVQKESKTDIAP